MTPLHLGDKEVEARSLAVRNVKTKKQVTVSIQGFIEKLVSEIAGKKLEPSVG